MPESAPIPLSPANASPQSSERRGRILDAAARCFVRAGFHRTTMQDVAAEAGMSPGNLYRYFPSKDAIVAGLAERDRAALGQDLAALEGSDDLQTSFLELSRKHFRDAPPDQAILCLEIWAEATRNPGMAAINREFERDIRDRLVAIFDKAKARGAVPVHVDAAAVALAATTLSNGLFVRRACGKDFVPDREIAMMNAIIGGLLAGSIVLPPLVDTADVKNRGPESSS